MATDNTSQSKASGRISRRRFIEAAGATGVAAGLGGCSDDGEDGGDGADGADDAGGGTTVGDAGDEEVTIVWNTHDFEDDTKEQMQNALHDFGLPDRITVEFEEQPGETTDDTQQTYTQWLNSGRESPDILTPDTAWSIPYVVQDHVLNLSEHMSQEKLDYMDENFVDALKGTMSDDSGDYYGVQWNTDIAGIQYRKDLVEEAGYDPEGENWATESMTWEKFSQVVADVLEQNPDMDYGYAFQGRAYEGLVCCNYNEWVTSFGGTFFGGRDNLFGPVNDRPITFDEEPHYQALQMIRTFLHGQDDEYSLDRFEGNIAPSANLQWAEEGSRQPFTDGNAVANRNWPYAWAINGAEEEFGEDLGVMPLPEGVPENEAQYEDTGGIGRSFIGGWTCMVNPNSEHVEEAVTVLEHYIGNEEIIELLFDRGGQLPPDLAMLEGGVLDGVGVLGRYTDVLKTVAPRAIPRAATVAWGTQSDQIGQEVNGCLNQDQSPEETLTTLEDSIADIEERFEEEA